MSKDATKEAERLRRNQKRYYYRHREKILARKRAKYAKDKRTSEQELATEFVKLATDNGWVVVRPSNSQSTKGSPDYTLYRFSDFKVVMRGFELKTEVGELTSEQRALYGGNTDFEGTASCHVVRLPRDWAKVKKLLEN